MDPSEVDLDNGSAGCSVPLIPDPEHRPERENLSSTSPEDENSLFQDAVSFPVRKTRIRRRQKRKLKSSSASISTSDDSFSVLPLKKKITEYVKNPFRAWRRWKRPKKRKDRSLEKRKRPRRKENTTKRKPYSVPLEERRRRLFDRGIQFPFRPFKYLPFKQYFTYEQLVLGGFLNQVKNLKYERSLKECLEDTEVEENLGIREYSYMDEDGPLSPISEPGENLNEDEAEEEAFVVENSDFILNCEVPSKKKWRKKNQHMNKS